MKKMKGYIKNYLKEVNDNGFSLLELVVAVGVLLVLTVGGLLAYNGFTKNARMAAVQSAADEVYTGAVAYDANGEVYTQAATEWMETRNGASIEVETWKSTTGAICAEAEMVGYPDIAVKRGAGCDGTPVGDGSGNPGDGTVITDPATAATCFDFNAGTITDYNEELDECGTDVVIPDTINGEAVVGIGTGAFFYNNLTSVEFPSALKSIGVDAFHHNNLTSVEFPDGLESIGGWAFASNTSLTSVEFNDGLETIGQEAFYKNNLTSVELPSSLKSIGEEAFYGNNNLTSVRVSKNTVFEEYTFGSRANITRY